MSTFEIDDQRWALYHRANGRCEVCDAVLPVEKGEMAHRIAKSRVNIQRFGEGVVHHLLNLMWACAGACNDACNIGFKTVPVETLVRQIRLQIIEDAGVALMQHPHLHTKLFDHLAKIAREG